MRHPGPRPAGIFPNPHRVAKREAVILRWFTTRREQWDAIDRIGEFAQQVKQAINQADKTELAEPD